MRLTFKGGVHPFEGKEMSKDCPVEKYLPKADLAYPLSQHIGAPAKPVVAKGDHVLAGQMIAEAGGFVSAPVHASVSGTVKGIEKRLTATGSTSGSCQTFLDAFHRTGYRSMNRGRYKSACFCDHLACKHVVPLCNHRLRRSTNVLGQWIRQICLREIFLHRAVL